MSDPLHDPGVPAPRRPDSELEAPDFLGRPMPGTGRERYMGMRAGSPGCALVIVALIGVVWGAIHRDLAVTVLALVGLVIGAVGWGAAIRADVRHMRGD